jgi:hypothetical protein
MMTTFGRLTGLFNSAAGLIDSAAAAQHFGLVKDKA